MIVYRITKAKYKNDISGMGAKLYGSRWNPAGIPVLYAAENISLAVLEALVHLEELELPTEYWLLKIQLPGEVKISTIEISKLKKNWINDEAYTQYIGTQFINNGQSLMIAVPSAVINEECNYLINPSHKDFAKIRIQSTREFNFDTRLLSFK
jgi:RES domain-containing protein